MNHQLPSSNLPLPKKTESPSQEFDVPTQLELFSNLKQVKFSGKLTVSNSQGIKWNIYLHLGCVFYADGGIHTVKRWYRNLMDVLGDLSDLATWLASASQVARENSNRCWQYQLLCNWVQQGKITREQATQIIWSILVEVWFDSTQSPGISYELQQSTSSSTGIILLDGGRIVTEVARQREDWQKAKVDRLNLNRAPIIKQVEQMEQSTSPTVFQMLDNLLDGQNSLRELAIAMNRQPLTVACFLSPYIQSGLIELVNVPDLPAPLMTVSSCAAIEKPLIACVDDSPLICQSLEKFLTAKGYRFTGINDPLRAFSVLLALKPDLIFLDLMMPNTNGYEVCEKLRRISYFRHTPIVILTGNDGVIDRMKAKIVGASGFLSKTKVDASAVVEVLDKHLRHCTLRQLASADTSRQAA